MLLVLTFSGDMSAHPEGDWGMKSIASNMVVAIALQFVQHCGSSPCIGSWGAMQVLAFYHRKEATLQKKMTPLMSSALERMDLLPITPVQHTDGIVLVSFSNA